MAPSDQPLLSANKPPSETSDDRHAEEEDELLTGQHKTQNNKYGWAFWREVGAFTWALVATVVIIVLAVMLQHRETSSPSKGTNELEGSKPSGKRNLIFMVSDGMGPTSLSLTRSFRQRRGGLPNDDILQLDPHLIGSSRTKSTSSLITDSAAGATAFSCGLKSYNGAISTLPDGTPCGTVMEAAKRAGYLTGLVVTTRISDATPACFAAHVHKRSEEDTIAKQLVGEHPLGQVVDLIFGGGRCHFLPNTTDGSCRGDSIDVVEMAKKNGFSYASTREEFDSLDSGRAVKLPMLGLFASHDIPYEIDRQHVEDKYPSLDEMAQTALKALSTATKDSDKGFFLMIEGSRIDHAGHANDPAAQVHEVLAYDKAFKSVIDFLEKDSTDGVAVGTSDHETGGLAVAKQLHPEYPEYLWYPGALVNASASSEHLTHDLYDYKKHPGLKDKEQKEYVESLIKGGLGIQDASDAEIDSLVHESDGLQISYIFADMISRRAQSGWTTHGHSAADVNIYASSPGQVKALIGNHENTEVGNFLRDYLDLDLAPITEELKSAKSSFSQTAADGIIRENVDWMGQPPSADEVPGLNQLDHYAGDFRKRGLACDCDMH